MRAANLIVFSITLAGFGLFLRSPAAAACPALPYTLANGQIADAIQVMADFTSVINCISTPTAGVQVSGAGGGTVTIQNPAATSNYNFNLPATLGAAGTFLTSSGSATSATTWTAPGPDFQISGNTLALAPTSVTAGSYTLPNIVVDGNGRLTGASNGPGTGSSGHVLPFLDGNNTWSGAQTFQSVLGTVSTQSGTSYTLTATDCGTTVIFTNSSSIVVTTLSSLPSGCAVALEQRGAGQVSVAAGAGSSVHSPHNFTKTYGQYAILGLFVDQNPTGSAAEFVLSGDGA